MKRKIVYSSNKVCPNCGKSFTVFDQWAFKAYNNHRGKYEYMCSWHCLLAFEREHESVASKKDREQTAAYKAAIERGDYDNYPCAVRAEKGENHE